MCLLVLFILGIGHAKNQLVFFLFFAKSVNLCQHKTKEINISLQRENMASGVIARLDVNCYNKLGSNWVRIPLII